VRLRPTWTSLPGAAEASAGYTMARALEVYRKHGGRLATAPVIDDGTQPAAPIEYRDTPARPEDSGRINNPDQDSPMPFPIMAAASLALPLLQSLLEAFSPLGKAKIARELNRHTDDPAISQQIADNVMAALMKLTGKTDPVEAVVAVKSDPAVAVQAEAVTIEELDKLAPLDRLRAIFWRLYEFSREHPQYFELIFVDRAVPRISREYERFAFAREMKAHLLAHIQACIDAGLLPATLNPNVAFRLLTMGLFGAAMMRLSDRLGRGEDADTLASDVLNVTLRGLQSGVALESTFVDCGLDEVDVEAGANAGAAAVHVPAKKIS